MTDHDMTDPDLLDHEPTTASRCGRSMTETMPTETGIHF